MSTAASASGTTRDVPVKPDTHVIYGPSGNAGPGSYTVSSSK